MDIFSQILESFGIRDYDNLNEDEQVTLRSWVEKIEKAVITLDDVKQGVTAMKEAVEFELSNWKNPYDQDVFLKARLKNLILLDTILNRPEKARAALEGYMKQAKNQIK